MPDYDITSSSLLAPHPFAHYAPQQLSSEQGSKTSLSSCSTIDKRPKQKHILPVSSPRSVPSFRLHVRNENVPLHHNLSNPSLPPTPTPVGDSSKNLLQRQKTRRSSWEDAATSCLPTTLTDQGRFSNVDLTSLHGSEKQNQELNENAKVSLDMDGHKSSPKAVRFSESSQESTAARKFEDSPDHPFKHDRPFRKWVGALRSQSHKVNHALTARETRWDLEDFEDKKPDVATRKRRVSHLKASSWSLFGSGSSISKDISPPMSGAKSEAPTPARHRFLRSKRSTTGSDGTNSSSAAEYAELRRIDYQATLERAMQRQKVLEELLSSEKSYVADLKVLLHVYAHILDCAPKVAQAAQPGISQNVGEILHLHEEMLFEIDTHVSRPESEMQPGHARGQSADTLESVFGEKITHAVRRSLDIPWLGRRKRQSRSTAPQEAAKVARIFDSMVCATLLLKPRSNLIHCEQLPRFFLYEEYGAKYELMLQSMGSLSKTLPTWSSYERGIESLVHSLLPQNGGTLGSKKGLTFEDLLIKVTSFNVVANGHSG
ncbi:hypothetical protein ACLMJK_008566 [Lecanora helva]